jgi:hypothetical protein
MKLAVWKTGHQIADTVADAFADTAYYTDGPEVAANTDINICYGILRGTDKVFRTASLFGKHWFNVDKGYTNPGHFDGNYRISYKGTQAKWHEGIPQADIDIELEDWRDNKEGYVLICPPTEPVKQFFDVADSHWQWMGDKDYKHLDGKVLIREKSDQDPIDWPNIKGVITFNSSVGWQALQRGIPCVSDAQHSLVGSYYKHELDKLNLEYNLENVKLIPRKPLFRCMGAHQFTLMEIRQGKAWDLLSHYLGKS